MTEEEQIKAASDKPVPLHPNKPVFEQITLKLSQGKCKIYDISPSDIWISGARKATSDLHRKLMGLQPYPYDVTPFLFCQLITIDDKQLRVDQLDELSIDDYMQIAEIVNTMVAKLQF